MSGAADVAQAVPCDDEHAELRRQYCTAWAEEDGASTARWVAFLEAKAGRPITNDAEAAASVREVLPPLLPSQPRATVSGRELDALVLAGVPSVLRGAVWPMFLRVGAAFAPGYYEQLVQVVEAESTSPSTVEDTKLGKQSSGRDATATSSSANAHAASSSTHVNAASCSTSSKQACVPAERVAAWRAQARTWLGQIDKDTHRTLPDRLDASGRAALRRLLAAFTLHDPATGYCQGMNFVAGGLLLFIGNEATAFACLAALAADVVPGFYSPAMVAPQVDQHVFVHLVSEHFPDLFQHLTALGVAPGNVIAQWFLCAFVTVLPFEVAARVWDVLFYERCPAVLFRVALALVEIYSAALEAAGDVLDASDLMQNMGSLTYDASKLVNVSASSFADVTPAAVQLLQQRFRGQVISRMESSRFPKAAAAQAANSKGVPAIQSAPGPPITATT